MDSNIDDVKPTYYNSTIHVFWKKMHSLTEIHWFINKKDVIILVITKIKITNFYNKVSMI